MRARIDDPAEKSVLVALAEHAGPDGRNAYPSIQRLVAYTSLGESTVHRKLAALLASGLVSSVERVGGRGKATVYSINVIRLRHMKHPAIANLDGDLASGTAISGGVFEDAKGSRSDTLSSRKGPADDGKGPAAGLEPPERVPQRDPNLKYLTSFNQEDSEISLSRIWQQVMTTLRNGQPGSLYFEGILQPTRLDALDDELALVACASIDQAAWLEDRATKILEHTLAGVLGRKVRVEFRGRAPQGGPDGPAL